MQTGQTALLTDLYQLNMLAAYLPGLFHDEGVMEVFPTPQLAHAGQGGGGRRIGFLLHHCEAARSVWVNEHRTVAADQHYRPEVRSNLAQSISPDSAARFEYGRDRGRLSLPILDGAAGYADTVVLCWEATTQPHRPTPSIGNQLLRHRS